MQYYMGVVTRCDRMTAGGTFIRDDGHHEDMVWTLNVFRSVPAIGSIVIGKADGIRNKFRMCSLKEKHMLDRMTIADAMNWVKTARI